MGVNTTDKSFYRTPEGEVYSGDEPPSGSTLIVAPGGTLDDTLAERLGVKDQLGSGEHKQEASDGEPLVTLPTGRAVALSSAPPEYREKPEHQEYVKQNWPREAAQAQAQKKSATPGEFKAVRPESVENKGGIFGSTPKGSK